MTNAAITGAEGTSLPRIHHVCETTSALDIAYELASRGMLNEWDSVLAQSQTEGRGQMRRKWISPPGNLYAALRLPPVAPFDSESAAIAMGALLANAISDFGCRIRLKWPNDLVLVNKDIPAKLGGILLEEKHGQIFAGIGINILHAPTGVESMSGLPAASLALCCREALPGPDKLWRTLVKHLRSVYKNEAFFSHVWKNLAESLLLWRGQMVEIYDGGERSKGVFRGLNDLGCAILEDRGVISEKMSGSMRPL